MTTASSAARKGHAFRWVAAVFVVLLAAGFALGIAVYGRYVAYEAVAARHVPRDAAAFGRFDLTHVTLYEPFRRSIFPLVDALPSAATAAGRRGRLERSGISVGAQVREVVVALGPAPGDWVVVLGGTLPQREAAASIADVLRAEGHPVESHEGGYSVGGRAGLQLAQAGDGALILASSGERLRAALPVSESAPELSEAAGGLVSSAVGLTAPLSRLTARFRAGSVFAVTLQAVATPNASPAEAETALRALLGGLSAGAPNTSRAVSAANLETAPGEVRGELTLPREAVEELAARIADRVQQR